MAMDWLVYVAFILIFSELPALLLAVTNFWFSLKKSGRQRHFYTPRTVLIIPCKWLDENFEHNISSFYRQDYDDYLLWFVVESCDDPVYEPLCKMRDRLLKETKAKDVRVLISGTGRTCSQKIHNLLYAYQQIPADTEVLAFADSDIYVKQDWLECLVHRLRKEKIGATTGYRWYVPTHNNFATLALVAINAKITQLLGNTPFNQAWGGSMAIKAETFRELGIDKIWQKAVSDDFSLTVAVKKGHKKVEFVPDCIVPTYESTTWSRFFEFGRRQFIITKVAAPKMWLLALFSSLCSVFGLWGGLAMAVFAISNHYHVLLFIAVPVLFFTAQLFRAVLRQKIAAKVLADDWPRLKVSALADVLLFWLWSLLLLFLILSSAFGRTITWRGIRYKLLGPAETLVLGS
jgi:cellulose synthase/poly-beta-1,6-N-acetylglucosamine synthase-like glycosyltransferase